MEQAITNTPPPPVAPATSWQTLPMPAAMKLRRTLRPLLHRIWYAMHLYLHRKPGRTKVGELELHTNPEVFHPGWHFSSRILADYLHQLELDGSRVLDMGTGSGIIGIVAAQRGAEVVAIDVNPEAAALARRNARACRVGKAMRVLCGDFFEPLRDAITFDWIIFNPPFYAKPVEDAAQVAYHAGDDHQTIIRFLERAGAHLAGGGKTLLIVSSDMHLADLFSIFDQLDYKVRQCDARKHLFEIFYLVQLMK